MPRPNSLTKRITSSIIFGCLFTFFLQLNSYSSNYYEKSKTNNLVYLKTQIQNKIKQYPQLSCGVYIQTNCLEGKENYININGDSKFSAASLIKLPIAILILKEIDSGNLDWNKVLILKKHHYAAGAGLLIGKRVGTKIPLKDVFKLMLTISDNTATNMLIELLGGVNLTNSKISKLGVKNTILSNWLGDFKGTNKTSPHNLITLLENSLEGNWLKKTSRDYLKNTLLNTKTKYLINTGLEKNTKFAHKTGNIGVSIGDAGIIYLENGKRINIAIIIKRPFNDYSARLLIKDISSLTYKNFK